MALQAINCLPQASKSRMSFSRQEDCSSVLVTSAILVSSAPVYFIVLYFEGREAGGPDCKAKSNIRAKYKS